jgi:hypothetical protein
MGGSGGFFGGDPKRTLEELRQSQEESDRKPYEAECNNVLAGYLAEFNARDSAAIDKHLAEIKKALERDIDGVFALRFGGSVAKHTYVDGLSDVDSLVLLDGSEFAKNGPEVAKDYLARRLKERFPKTEIVEGRLAVTVKFADVDVQLLPAVREGDGYKIAAPSGDAWAAVRPRKFADVLTRVNEKNAGKVVPTVKLAKAIIAELPEKYHVTGYHAESLAVEVFKDYKGPLRVKDMLANYFSEAAGRVLAPIRDRTGQSVHVDEYLGPERSLDRAIVADAFARVARRMRNADAQLSVSDWRKLFGE